MGPPSGLRAHSSGTTGGTQVSQPRARSRTAHGCCPWGCPGLQLCDTYHTLQGVADVAVSLGLPFWAPDHRPCLRLTVLSTDERPYKCAKCGKSFRESGALTRHLKSLTPCTEKIRFSMSKDMVIGKEETPAGQRGGGAPCPAPGCWPGHCPGQGGFFKDSLGYALKGLVPPLWGPLHHHQ